MFNDFLTSILVMHALTAKIEMEETSRLILISWTSNFSQNKPIFKELNKSLNHLNADLLS